MPIRRPRKVDKNKPDGLIRLNKRMTELRICSRREADAYIKAGKVLVDGKVVSQLGTKVPISALVELDLSAEKEQAERLTVLIHKPAGYVSAQAEHGHKPAVELLRERNLDRRYGPPPWGDEGLPAKMWKKGLAPAGRLDHDSTGLLVLTADGTVAGDLIGPRSEIEKEYLVTVQGVASPADLDRLRHGLHLDGKALAPARVERDGAHRLRFTLKEGRKRQIRRMCKLVGLEVKALHRVRIGKMYLGALDRGHFRFLQPDEGF